MSLAKKLISGFLCVAVIVAVVGIAGYGGLRYASRSQAAINSVYLPGVNGLWMIKDGVDVVRRVELVMFLTQLSPAERAGQKKNLTTAWGKAEAGWAIYAPIPKQGEESALWEQFRAAFGEYKQAHERVIDLLDKSPDDRENAYDIASSEGRDKFKAVQTLIDKLLATNGAAAELAVKAADRQAAVTGYFALGMAILGVAASLLLGILLSSGIARNMKAIVESLRDNSGQVQETAVVLTESARQLSEGAAEEASSLAETSSSMDEVSAIVKKNTENASQARTLADRAGESVERANVSMGAMLESMQDISASSEETGKIIKTIDEIAFQTNLLALNAAVEAARAGEAGAGFAVVADEVRNLAQRAASAARNTSELIEGVIRKISGGTALVEKTNADFKDVADSVGSVTRLVGEIADASKEQSQRISDVGRLVSQVGRVTQRTAAQSEDIANSAEDLSFRSASLEGTVTKILALVEGGAEGVHPANGKAALSQATARRGTHRALPARGTSR